MKLSPLKFLVIAILSLSTLLAQAQQKYLFKIKYIPDKTYKSKVVNSISMEMNFEGDSVKLQQMASSGMKLPIRMDMLQDMEMLTKTGAARADKQIPLTISYDKMNTTQKLNGNEMPTPPNPLGSAKMEGRALENGKLVIDTITGDIQPELKKMMSGLIEKIQKNIAFPELPMKIGDKFSQDIPMTIPIGTTPIKIIAKAEYTLKEVKGQTAIFDLIQNLTLDFSTGEANASATGSGTGKVIYDFETNFVSIYEGDVSLNMKMPLGELEMTAKAKTTTTMAVTIE